MRVDDPGLSAVLRQLRRRGGAGCEWYKPACLARRIEIRMRARGVDTLAGYAGLLTRDRAEADRLLHTISVRVTGFFRDPETWRRLRELLADAARGRERLSGWSMGCSTGEEAWSLAMLFLAAARCTGSPPESMIRVDGSDIDEQALAIARRGSYPASAARSVGDLLGEPFGTVEGSQFRVSTGVQARVTFRREDLTKTLRVADRHDLVCCRNLLIFLGREGQRRVLEAAVRSLRPGGLLVLGKTESLAALPAGDLSPVDSIHRVYRRAG